MTAGRVVYVHGIWMHGMVMAPLKRQIEREHGFAGEVFTYPSVHGSVAENAELLADFLRDFGDEPVHLVGHSLGGVLILYLLAHHAELPPGRIVCLGSPLRGSQAGASLRRHGWGRKLLGNTIGPCVLEHAAAEWAGEVVKTREVGVIAGNLALGVGQLITRFHEPSDGTVTVAETCLDGASDRLELKVNHMGMLLSRQVAHHTAAFLRTGRFLQERASRATDDAG